MRRANRVFLWAIVWLVVFPVLAVAQTASTGLITGTVTDPTGAVVVGAKVKLLDEATGTEQSVETSGSGQFTFPRVSPGVYTITVTMEGFRTHNVREVRVETAKSHRVNVSLEVGALAEMVEVTAETEIVLQTADATVGTVIGGEPLLRFPSLTRNASELLTLQPGAIPEAGGADFGNNGGAITGARSDQNTFTLDGIDVTENSVGSTTSGGGAFRTLIPLNVDSIEEFRVGVANPNATFSRSAGGQVAVVSRSGSNNFHGAAYWYHQNDNLNANTWDNNRNDVPKAETKDNRYGFRLGGPIWRDKMFFFANYEGRDFPRSFNTTRIVPTDTFRQGILLFEDAAGNTVSYDMATSALCGPTNTDPCDPRGIGLSPTMSSLFGLYPSGNDPALGDGLNTIGFRSTASAPLETDFWKFRYDYNITNSWRFDGSFNYFRALSTLGDNDAARQQLDITGSQPVFTGVGPTRDNSVILGLTGQIGSTMTNSFRFGWTKDRTGSRRLAPSDAANLLALAGTDSSAGFVAMDLAGTFDSLLSEPIDAGTQRARTQGNDNETFQLRDDFTWVKGSHTIQAGFHHRRILTRHDRNDKVIGSLSSLVANIDADDFVTIPDTSRPPTCGGGVTVNCLVSGDVSQWDRLFAIGAGMVDDISVLMARDGDLNALPFGTPLTSDTKNWVYEYYAQDVWRINPAFTLTLGLSYGWQQPPVEKLGRQTFMINNDTGEILTYNGYVEARREAALSGNVFTPELGFVPINESDRSRIFDIDRNNWGPRVAAAWSPSYQGGFFGGLFGDRKTVIRGGFSLVYDRVNTVGSVIIPMLGVGFGQTINISGPLCNASGAGGAGCNATSTNDAESAFRMGVDGQVPVPAVPAATVPVVPGFIGEILSFQLDPDYDVGANYSFNLTWQRELPGDMLLEVGYVARLGRDLPTSGDINSNPFFHVDPASGQTFAEAFDAVAAELRAGTPAASATPQPWFENQLPGLDGLFGTASATEAIIAGSGVNNFIDGDVSTIFLNMDIFRQLFLGLDPFDNTQILIQFLRSGFGRSNYNGGFVTLRKRMSRGLAFDLNYTFSRSLDQGGFVQNGANTLPNAFVPDFDYGPSRFDRTHVFNATSLYELPFGRNRAFSSGNWADHLIGGWYISGIFRAASGLPIPGSHGVAALGGGLGLQAFTGLIPTSPPAGTGAHFGVTGGTASDGSQVGTDGDVNMFRDPAAVWDSLRRIRLSEDGRTGRANPFRGLGSWNLDFTLGKKTSIKETVDIIFSFDFFNIFNHVNLANPGNTIGSFTDPGGFGVITQQADPANRQAGSRWIQFGFRVEF